MEWLADCGEFLALNWRGAAAALGSFACAWVTRALYRVVMGAPGLSDLASRILTRLRDDAEKWENGS
jgi:hypothetical protein